MSDSAQVKSIESLHFFRAAVVRFQETARQSVTSLEVELLKILGWLERDRPGFWKREIETCYREMGEARVRLHKCRMRRVGDFRPTCFEEQKDLEKAKKDLEFAQKQIPVVKYWNVCAQQEANEYHGRSSQLTQMLERDVPELLALLHHAIDRLEAYNNLQLPGAAAPPPPPQEPDAAVDAVDTSPAASADSQPAAGGDESAPAPAAEQTSSPPQETP